MEKLTIKNLENLFKGASETGAEYIAVAIQVKDYEKLEIIITPKSNFDKKLNFYRTTYNDDLTHKDNESITIIGFTYGNNFRSIERDLM